VGAQLSLNRDFSELSAIRNPVREFVSSILDRSASIGVRGEITRNYLIHLGFPGDLIDVIGCPSMFYNGESMQVTKPDFPDRIALNFNITGIRDPRILEFTSYFNSHPENVTYIPQVRRLMPSVARGESPDPTSPVSIENVMPRVMQPDRIAFFCDVSPWIEFMKGQSFSIGTRIHGNIVPLLAGTPSHVIAHDSRTLELARYFEIPHTPLDELSGFDVIKTFQKSDYTGVVRGHPARTRAFADFLQRNGLNHILYDAPAMERYEAKLQRSYESDRLPKRMSFLGSLALRSKNLRARVFRSHGGAH
jgi:hypothetical protein